MIKRKTSMLIAVALVTSVFIGGGTGVRAFASELNHNKEIVEQLKGGIYEVENKTSYITPGNETGESMARRALEKTTKLTIKNGKTYMKLNFNKALYSFMQNIKVSIDGKDIKIKENKDDKSIEFEVPSPESKIHIGMFITAMGRDVEMFVVNDMSTLKTINEMPIINAKDITVSKGDKIDLLSNATALDKEDGKIKVKVLGDTSFIKDGVAVKSGTYKVTYRAEDKGGLVSTKDIKVTVKDKSEGNKDNKNEKDGDYSIQNDVKYIGNGNAEIGNSMARRVLKETSEVNIKNGKIYTTLEFDKVQYGFLKNIKINVNGKNVNFTENNRKIKFEVPSLNSKIVVSAFVTAMNKDVSFQTILKEDTLKKINSSEGSTNKPEENKDNTSKNENKQNNKTENKSSSTKADKGNDKREEVIKGKLYTIKNKVTHKSQTGIDMARKNLDSTSQIEEVNGKTYLTLTFTGGQYMKDYEIYVNGNKVNHKITYRNGNITKVRFEIPNLDSKMKVKCFVIPMGRNVEFGVELLKDTLKFEKEYKVNGNELKNESGISNKLPATGMDFVGNALAGLGAIGLGALSIISKRK
ncbi:NEAT domain-containing protein [Eubacterium multiforme]|uniref:NEAT domain-containing protein n=1 Tax=Eubacterium multiforme TaxID=83339 RepID=A0ABT9UXB9_9FIRM|nr:NEAT domain-containing protein [Eubacterium multiforme]MDQ0150953.1 hypothetical protein [Eubacterium multiforme]